MKNAIYNFLPALFILISSNFMFACATHYKGVSIDESLPPDYSVSTKVLYTIKPPPVLMSSGITGIRDAITSSKVLNNLENYYEKDIPEKGIYVLIEPKYKTPDLPALIFGYLSVSTLTIFPAWSNNDGFDVFYRIYSDGELKKTFRYETRRFLAAWLFLLPFVWTNLFTTGEYEAFYATTYDFIRDAQPYFAAIQ